MTREELLSQAFKDENGISWIPVDTSSNPDLIDLLRSGDHIIYKCKNCGLELKKYYDVRHKDSTKESLCQSCRMTECEDRNVPVIITDKAQLDNLKYGQKFTYNCVKCGKTCTYDFRPQRKNLYSTMMCGECRVHSSRESNWNYNGDKEITLNITDYSDFDSYNIRNGQKIHYICKGCGADVNVRFSHGEDNKREDGLRRMLCSTCAHKDTYNKMYGGNITSNLQTDETKEQIKQTNLNTYGVDHYSKTEEFKERIINNSRKKYGTDYPQQNLSVKIKSINTRLKNYGTTAPITYRYKYDNLSFDSKEELAFYIFCIYNRIPISRIVSPIAIQGTNNTYTPDFLIYNKWYVEIKGNHLIDENGMWVPPPCKYTRKDEGHLEINIDKSREFYLRKQRCAEENNVWIIPEYKMRFLMEWVRMVFGRNYLRSFSSNWIKNKVHICKSMRGICNINKEYMFYSNGISGVSYIPLTHSNYVSESIFSNEMMNDIKRSYFIEGGFKGNKENKEYITVNAGLTPFDITYN